MSQALLTDSDDWKRSIILDISEQYQQRVISFIEEIRKSGSPVLIFGAGRAGWYIMKVLEYYDVPITAFADNDPGKQNIYYNYQVLSPNDSVRRFPNAHVFLGIFLPDTAVAVQKQLQQLNFQHVYFDTAAFLFTFFVSVAGRT